MAEAQAAVESTDEDRFFWNELAEGRFAIQRCANCHAALFPPGPACWHCASHDLTWETLASRPSATVYSWTICYTSYMDFAALVPYTIAIGELDDVPGIRVVARVLHSPAADAPARPLAIGDRLELRIEPGVDGRPSYGWVAAQ